MTPATSNRRSNKEILDALQAQLDTVMLADETTKAFERIERFDVESLTEAFQLLIISEQRICVMVVLDEQLEQIIDSDTKLVVTRMLPVALMISDRILGDRVKALFGDPEDESIPGAFALAELVLPAVTGQLIGNEEGKSGIVSKPAAVNSIFLKQEDQQNLPGRAAVMIELHCAGGMLEAQLGIGPTL